MRATEILKTSGTLFWLQKLNSKALLMYIPVKKMRSLKASLAYLIRYPAAERLFPTADPNNIYLRKRSRVYRG